MEVPPRADSRKGVRWFDAAGREGVCSKLALAFRGSTKNARQIIEGRAERADFQRAVQVDCETTPVKV